MKFNSLVIVAVAAVAVACTAKVSDTTTLIGTFENKVPDEVHIMVPMEAIDTVVKTVKNQFQFELKTNPRATGTVEFPENSATFIPDGTKLTLAFNDESGVTITSNKPKISVQTRFSEYTTWFRDFMNGYNHDVKVIRDSTALTQNQKDSLTNAYYENSIKDYVSHNMEVLTLNKNNYVTSIALQNVANELEDAKLDSLIGTLDSTIIKSEYCRNLVKGIYCRKATAEGQQFTDFAVVQTPGDTVKFSKYVGQGKYMLVDFWASWCGPCKREIPNVKNIYDKYHGDNFDVLSVAVWDAASASKDTAAVYGVNWNQIINANKIPTEIYGIEGIPHIILFAPDGKILKRDLRGEDIEKEIAKYVQPVAGK